LKQWKGICRRQISIWLSKVYNINLSQLKCTFHFANYLYYHMWWLSICFILGGRYITLLIRGMIVVLQSVSGVGVRFTQSYFYQMERAHHWNLFLYQKSSACFRCKGDEKTGPLDVVKYLSAYVLFEVVDSWVWLTTSRLEQLLIPCSRMIIWCTSLPNFKNS